MKARATALILYDRYYRSVFAVLAGVCALSAFLYGFFLLEAVAHAAQSAHAASAVKELKSNLSVLESQYLASTEALTPERATALGLVPPKSISVVYAVDPSRALTLASAPLSIPQQ